MGFDVLVFPEGTRSAGRRTPAVSSRCLRARSAGQGSDRASQADVRAVRAVEATPDLEGRGQTAVLTIEPFEVIEPYAYQQDSRAICRENRAALSRRSSESTEDFGDALRQRAASRHSRTSLRAVGCWLRQHTRAARA